MKCLILLLSLIGAGLSGCAKKAQDKIPEKTAENIVPANYATDTGKVTEISGGQVIVSTDPVTDPTGLKYLALGDSYTIGQSVSQDQSFPYQLMAQLNLTTKVSPPTIIATTGWTTYDLIMGINNSGLTNKTYDFVTLLIGVNDQYRGMAPDSYKARFIVLLNTAIRFAHGNKSRVIVISIPDYGVTPAFSVESDETRAQITTELNQFNVINKSESANAGVNYLDITDISRLAATDDSLVASDGFHPSGKMYGLWVQRLVALIKPLLTK